MPEEDLLEIFDDELEVRTNRVNSRHVLIRKTIEDDSEIDFSDDDVLMIADYIAKSLSTGQAKIFYIHLHDNIVKELVFLEDYSGGQCFLEKSIQNFTSNPAKEGGCSLLGIVSLDSRQLLTALFEPYYEIRVSSFRLAK